MPEKLKYCWECGKQITTGIETRPVRGPFKGRPLRFCDYQCIVEWDATTDNRNGAQALNLEDVYSGKNSRYF